MGNLGLRKQFPKLSSPLEPLVDLSPYLCNIQYCRKLAEKKVTLQLCNSCGVDTLRSLRNDRAKSPFFKVIVLQPQQSNCSNAVCESPENSALYELQLGACIAHANREFDRSGLTMCELKHSSEDDF